MEPIRVNDHLEKISLKFGWVYVGVSRNFRKLPRKFPAGIFRESWGTMHTGNFDMMLEYCVCICRHNGKIRFWYAYAACAQMIIRLCICIWRIHVEYAYMYLRNDILGAITEKFPIQIFEYPLHMQCEVIRKLWIPSGGVHTDTKIGGCDFPWHDASAYLCIVHVGIDDLCKVPIFHWSQTNQIISS